MARNWYAISWEIVRSGLGFTFLLQQDDWFRTTTYLSTGNYNLRIYFILSIVVTGWLVIKNSKEDQLGVVPEYPPIQLASIVTISLIFNNYTRKGKTRKIYFNLENCRTRQRSVTRIFLPLSTHYLPFARFLTGSRFLTPPATTHYSSFEKTWVSQNV